MCSKVVDTSICPLGLQQLHRGRSQLQLTLVMVLHRLALLVLGLHLDADYVACADSVPLSANVGQCLTWRRRLAAAAVFVVVVGFLRAFAAVAAAFASLL